MGHCSLPEPFIQFSISLGDLLLPICHSVCQLGFIFEKKYITMDFVMESCQLSPFTCSANLIS